MTGLEAVRAAALAYLPYLVALPPVAVFAFLFDGVFIGATRTAPMRNGMVLALAVFLLFAWALKGPLGNHGLWLAMLAFMAARGLSGSAWSTSTSSAGPASWRQRSHPRSRSATAPPGREWWTTARDE